MNLSCIFRHKWSDWIHVSAKCREERFCLDCRELRIKDNVHKFGQWKQIVIEMAQSDKNGSKIPNSEYNKRVQQRHCIHCNYQEESVISWGVE